MTTNPTLLRLLNERARLQINRTQKAMELPPAMRELELEWETDPPPPMDQLANAGSQPVEAWHAYGELLQIDTQIAAIEQQIDQQLASTERLQ